MYSRPQIIVIAGLSGVGKSYMIELARKQHPQYANFSAGTLIKKRMQSLDRDELRKLADNQIIANQFLMIAQLEEELTAEPSISKVLFDAHMIIDNEAELIQIPFDVFKQLAPTQIIHLRAEPQEILQRRMLDSTRKRPLRIESEIRQQQELSLKIAYEYGEKLGVPFTIISAGDNKMLLQLLGEI